LQVEAGPEPVTFERSGDRPERISKCHFYHRCLDGMDCTP
jgi:hypothetical protein